jgi:hypothetical protein
MPRRGTGGVRRRRRRHTRCEWLYKDFESVLALPERLAQYMRLLLHIKTDEWDFCMDKLRQNTAYREWTESKGKGRGVRRYAAPCNELKRIQKMILYRFLEQIPTHFCRHGNQRGSNIRSNAEHHAGNEHVFSIDIVDAFPSVFRSRIRANLRKPLKFALRQFSGTSFEKEEVEKLLESLVDLVCLHDRLPQGPPTSPRILDLVCCKMDKDLWKLLSSYSTPLQEYRITVWCDDITISSNSEIPERLRNTILSIMKKNGFKPHVRKDKTKYFAPSQGTTPVVTGIVLAPDGRITLAPNKVNQLRSRLNKLLKTEVYTKEIYGEISGTIGYIRHIYVDKLPSKLRAIVEKAETTLKTIKFNELAEDLGKKTKKRRKTTSSPQGENTQPSPENPAENPRHRSRRKKDEAQDSKDSIPFS